MSEPPLTHKRRWSDDPLPVVPAPALVGAAQLQPAAVVAVTEWRLTHAERPWTVNWERNHHWRSVGVRVKEWREVYRLLALEAKMPACGQVVIDVLVESKNRRWMADPGACWGAVKAAVDGIVDAGVLVDDTGEEVAFYRLWPPTVTGRDALTLVVCSLPESETL